MKTIHTVAFALLAAIGFTLAADERADKALEKAKIPEAKIQGAWELKFPDGSRRIKFVSDGMWTITQANPADGKVIFHHGGSYTFDGKTYVETVEFANAATLNLVGKRHAFELTLEGDTIHQVGVGNPWNEDWDRVKNK